VTDACEGCGHCTAVCTSNVRVHEEVRDWGMVMSPGCMKCGDCISVCPKDALYYGAGPIPWLAKPTAKKLAADAAAGPAERPRAKINWGDEAILAAGFAISFFIVRGLYGRVPFLMALGVGATMAFLGLTTVRLFRQRDLDRSGLRLKRDGKLLPWGGIFLASMAALTLFFTHSAGIQYRSFEADRSYAKLEGPRRVLLASPGLEVDLPSWVAGEAEAGIAHLEAIEKWGLFPYLGNAAKLASLSALGGDVARTEREAKRAIERDELPGEMHQLLARVALARNEPATAAAEWERSIAARPDVPEAYVAYGIFLAQSGDISAGQQVFDRGLRVVAASPQLFYNAALSRALMGQAQDSITFFEQALALDPQYLEARENLAGTLASVGRFGDSIVHYRKAVEQAPDDPSTRVLLAQALLGLGERDDALRELRQALQIDPANPEARALLEQLGGL
jgi:tetratricopeptide (TPR) repeat protein/ferredoxin